MTEVTQGFVDNYEVIKGLVSVLIYKDPITGLYIYHVHEPKLNNNASIILDKVKELLRTSATPSIGNDVDSYLEQLIERVARHLRISPSEDERKALVYYLKRDSLGYGKIDPILRDEEIEDVNINGPNKPVYVWHSRYEHLRTNVSLSSDELQSLIVKLSQRAGKNVNSANPIFEGLLPEGFRVELGLKDVAPYGPMVTIRKFKSSPITVVDLIIGGVMTPEQLALLWFAIEHRINALVIGPTGAGKTTLLNALLFLIRTESRIVTIEDTRELSLPHEQWVPLVVRESVEPGVRSVSAYDLVKVSMRIRPDYIVIGELRGEEAYIFFQAIASGHTGLATIHANSLDTAVRRLVSKPMNVPRALVPLINMVVHIDRVKVGDHIARKVVDMSEILDIRGFNPVVNRLFVWDRVKNAVVRGNDSLLIKRLVEENRVTAEEVINELNNRAKLLTAMAKYGFRSPDDIFRITRNYYIDPETTFKKVLGGELP